jgi:purine-binding chemotaxis protein CheW
MADPLASPATQAEASRFLMFRLDRRLYALPAAEVAEVIRMPIVAPLPHGPKGLLGIANLRGSVLPIASLRGLLGQELRGQDATSASQGQRAIVLNGAAPVAVLVDSIEALVNVEHARIEARQAELAADPGERLKGAFQAGTEQGVAKILDIQSLLADAFVQRARPQPRSHVRTETAADVVDAIDERQRLVTFDVAGQEYALELDAVHEIIAMPDGFAQMPQSEALVLGVAGFREGLLPLLSLRGLLGFLSAAESNGREKVVIVTVGGVRVGLVADRMRAILAADPAIIEPVPSVLAARAGGETRIKAIYRGEEGRRLISILAPEQLFREEVMQRLEQAKEIAQPAAGKGEDAVFEALRFVVFRLGDSEFGLPIEAVEEVARVPDVITRLPKTPKFLEGIVNLRGEVLPVVDQRRRFDMPKLEKGERRRLIVVRTQRHRAGLIVDSVSEVLSAAADAIAPAPDLTGEATSLVNGVINLEKTGRIVLIVNPDELLSRSERGLLDAFRAESRPVAS